MMFSMVRIIILPIPMTSYSFDLVVSDGIIKLSVRRKQCK